MISRSTVNASSYAPWIATVLDQSPILDYPTAAYPKLGRKFVLLVHIPFKKDINREYAKIGRWRSLSVSWFRSISSEWRRA